MHGKRDGWSHEGYYVNRPVRKNALVFIYHVGNKPFCGEIDQYMAADVPAVPCIVRSAVIVWYDKINLIYSRISEVVINKKKH